MKKVLSAFLAVLMCVMMIPVSAAAPADAQVIYTLTGANLKPGETAELTLHIKSLVDANSFALSKINIPEGLTLEEATITDAAKSAFFLSSYDAEKKTFVFGAMSPAKYDLDVATLKIKASDEERTARYGIGMTPVSKNSSVVLKDYFESGDIGVYPAPKAEFPSNIKLYGQTATYDGKEHSATITGTIPAGTEIEYKDNTAIDAGEYKASATLTAEGYNTRTYYAILKINPKALTVSGIKAADKVYDKTNTAVISGGTLSGVVSGDEVSASVPEKGEFASVNVGKNIAVSIDEITLEGKDAANYTLTNANYTGLKAAVSQAEITVTADSLSKRIGDDDEPLTYKVTEGTLYEGDTITGALARAKGETAGTYAITKGTLSAGANYKLTFVPGTYTINDKETQNVTVSGIPEKVTYGDEDFTVEVNYDEKTNLDKASFASSNDNVLSIDGSGNVKVVGAGNALLTVTVKGNDTYADFTKTFNVTVAKRKITVTADDASKKTGTEDPDEFAYTITEGSLVNGDEFSGKLARVAGEKAGEYKIQQGSLKLSANYELTFVAGTFTIADKKTQNVTVTGIPQKATYGDGTFMINVELDAQSGLSDVEYTSDNTKVADPDTDGNVAIVGAGTANITVTIAGDEEYADFAKTVKITVAKKDLTITIENKTKKQGEDDPEFTFTVTGLVDGDEVTGEPVRAKGEKLGTYAIRKGTLAVSSNYNVKFVEGKLTITDKTPQDITVDEIGELTYGDGRFTIGVNYDAASGLTDTTFKSSNTKILAVDADGNVTIKGAGTANITVTVAGNDEYAAFEAVLTVKVAKKAISVDGLDFANGLVESADILNGDKVEYDLSKATLTFDKETSEVTIKDFAIVENDKYVLADDQDKITVSANADDFAEVKIADPSAGTVTGAGYYLIGSKATLKAVPKTGYRVSGWYKGSTLVSSNATYTFTVTANVTLNVRFMKKSGSYTIPGGSNSGNKNNNDNGLIKDLPRTKIELTIGDKEVFVDNNSVMNDVAPVISNGRTMLPSRFVAEALGAQVEWDETERKVTITGNEKTIELYIGSRYAYVNGFQKMLETEPFIENDRTFTPIRFISELLGADVNWNETTRTVTITKY